MALALALTASAQTLPTGVERKSSMGGITEYGFPNGLRVLLYPDQANPKVTINITYLVGSRHEGYEQLEQKIRALTPEQVNAAFRTHIDPAAISIVKAGDFKAAGVYQ